MRETFGWFWYYFLFMMGLIILINAMTIEDTPIWLRVLAMLPLGSWVLWTTDRFNKLARRIDSLQEDAAYAYNEKDRR